MMYPFFRAVISIGLACTALAASAASAADPSPPMKKYKINVPPSADLSYDIDAQQKGLNVKGDAVVHWHIANQAFTVANETRAMMVGKILDVKSEGTIDDYGLAPISFTEKRFHKDPTTTTFDRQAKTISFTDSTQTYAIKGGEQDRSSVIWQLISVARAAPAQFRPGSKWQFFVAGQRDADPWTFTVIKQEKIKTQAGTWNTVHVSRAPPPDSKEQKLDIWLAPTLEWYPARIRFNDADGEYIEQTLKKVDKNPA